MHGEEGIDTEMNFVVIGAGGVGCLYGAKLARAGEKVVLVDTDSVHVAAIEKNGLQMDGESDTFTVYPTAVSISAGAGAIAGPSEYEGTADVALICVNSYSTAGAAATARHWLKPDGYAVTLQNGLGNVEILQEILGSERVVGGITFHGSAAHSPGCASHTIAGKTLMGELDETASPRLEALEKVLDKAGLGPVIEPNIMATIWGKFVHNCALNGICALTDLRPGYIRHVAELDDFQTLLIEEALALVNAEGFTLPEPDPLETIKAFCAQKFHQPSMMQHIAKGLETEIDSLNGYLVAESKKHGLAAPYNDALMRLVKGRQYQPKEG